MTTDQGLLPDGLLEIMQCLDCAGDLAEDAAASQLVCTSCETRYNVIDGIPVMLADEAIRSDGASASSEDGPGVDAASGEEGAQQD